MNPDVRIVPMSPAHIPTLAKLEKCCFSVPWTEAGLSEELLNPVAVFLVAQRAGEILGYAGMHHLLDEGNIINVAVFPERRRKGVASSLLFSLVRYGIENGLARLTLEVRPSNLGAVALYESFGFEQVGRRRGFYSKPPEDGLVMVKKL